MEQNSKLKCSLLNLCFNYFSFWRQKQDGTYCETQIGLQVMILLPPLPECCMLFCLDEFVCCYSSLVVQDGL